MTALRKFDSRLLSLFRNNQEIQKLKEMQNFQNSKSLNDSQPFYETLLDTPTYAEQLKRPRNTEKANDAKQDIDYTQKLCMAKCTRCQRRFLDEASVVGHIMTSHVPSNKLKCKNCDKKFQHSDKLRLHCYSVHQMILSQSDLIDLKGYYTADPILSQQYIKYGKFESIICNYCGVVVSSFAHFREHLVQHRKQNWTCETCTSFEGPPLFLENHLIRYHRIKRDKLCFCFFCGKAFGDATQLAKHIKDQASSGSGVCR
jgi:hypothetical protein